MNESTNFRVRLEGLRDMEASKSTPNLPTITKRNTPRPGNDSLRRRYSYGQDSSRVGSSPLRNSQKRGEPPIVVAKTTEFSSFQNKETFKSPPNGRLQGMQQRFFILEQVFSHVGGGVEVRDTIGIYTSKRAAEHAAKSYYSDHSDELDHCENCRFVTKEVLVDSEASKNCKETVVEAKFDSKQK